MTKKRVKFGLAILGGLAAFLLALLALVFAPTGASAGKGPVFGQEQDGSGQSDHPNLAYFEPPAGTGPSNGPGHSEEGVGPCVGTLCDTQDSDAPGDETWHYVDGEGGQGGNGQGNGHSPNPDSGDHPQGGIGNPWLFAGGFPGGGYGGGGAPSSNACSSQKDKDQDSKDKDKESGDKKTCDTDNADSNGSNGNDGNGDNAGNSAGPQQLTLLDDKNSDPNDDTSGGTSGNTSTELVSGPPGDIDDGLPPVDPNCFPFTEGCDTHNGNPPNGNPPDTVLTDPPNQVPEPLTLSLFAAGLAGAAALRRQQKKVARSD